MPPSSQMETQKDPAMSASMLRVAYDGPALRDGRMDVRDLAPALLSLGTAFQEANKVLHGDKAVVRVRVCAEFHPGSFEIALDITQTWPAIVLALFSGNVSSGAANLIEIMGFAKGTVYTGYNTVLGLIKKLRGRVPKSVTVIQDGNIKIEVDDEYIIIKKPVFDVFNDMKVRTAIHDAMRPICSGGIERFEVRDPAYRLESHAAEQVGFPSVIESVSREDLPALVPPEPTAAQPQEQLPPSTRQMMLTLVSVTFREGNKWRFWDGQSNLIAEVTDPNFLRQIEAREINFAKDDMLICNVTTRQSAGPHGLKTDHEITNVAKHIHLPRQMALPITPSTNGPNPIK